MLSILHSIIFRKGTLIFILFFLCVLKMETNVSKLDEYKNGIMSILWQSLLRHLLLRQSLLRLLILRQWPIVCNSGAFCNPNAVQGCPFNLKGAWFLSRSRKFFSYAALLFLKLFSAAQQNIFYNRKYYFM